MPAIEFPDDPVADLPFACGGPPLRGRLRVSPEDFQVDEQLGYAASGAGEHVFLQVRKRGLNTADVARALARFAGVRQVNVGFAGLKDRHALTTQYFSVHLPGKPDPDWIALNSKTLQVIGAQRSDRKIRRGSLRGNRFVLVLRDLTGERDVLEQRLLQIVRSGVPNYFGPQRFGYRASNLHRASALLAGAGKRLKPEQRRMLLAAARSYLFNLILAERVRQGNWNRVLPGEVLVLDGSLKQFGIGQPDPEIIDRAQQGDVHPSGLLPGVLGRNLVPGAQAGEVEQQALAASEVADWPDALARIGEAAERRPLRLMVSDLTWDWLDAHSLRLSFGLPSGAFATTLVRELMQEESGDPSVAGLPG